MRFALLLITSALYAQNLLDLNAIGTHLTPENPYIQSALLPQNIAQSHYLEADAPFDPRVGAQYERKRYPLGDADFYDLTLTQSLPYGVELFAGHRKAEGVAEYHNIKTGDEGEWRIGAKVDLFSLLHTTGNAYITRETSALSWQQSKLGALDELRTLGLSIMRSYFEAQYSAEALNIEREMLERVKSRQQWIEKQVQAGQIEAIALEENRAILLQQERRTRDAANRALGTRRTLGAYLGLELEAFDARYALALPTPPPTPALVAQSLFEHALAHRPDLRRFDLTRTRLALQKAYVAAEAYPKTAVALQGVHDERYDDSGFKLTLGAEFPLPQSRYKAQKMRLDSESTYVDALQERTLLELRTQIENGVRSVETMARNLEDLIQETALHVRLLEAEEMRFALGQSDLFRLNTRQNVWLSLRLRTLEATLAYRNSYEALLFQSAQESLFLIMNSLINH